MKRVIIIGAAGRDFHNFNTYFKDNDHYQVVAFTASQIPNIEGRRYPYKLAGDRYPEGIPIFSEDDLESLIGHFEVDLCAFSYSDVSYNKVMSISARVNAAGASFLLLGPKDTMITSTKPVIAVCATRTGCGKSPTSRKVTEILMSLGLKVVAIRHPMPYGNIANQKVQRFAELEDLKKNNCTIEEMEEYEPHIVRGNVVYSGVDYEAILREAENDPNGCDVILWDGGNNDFSFIAPDLWITVTDPHRVNHELSFYPGEVNLRMADIVIINKIDSALPEDIIQLRKNITKVNPHALVIDGVSAIRVDKSAVITGKKVLVIEDGPTLTHGDMKFGAGVVAAQKYGASQIIDPRDYAVGRLADTYKKYPNIGPLLPAMGYSEKQIKDLEATIDAVPCDSVVIGTPIDLSRIINFNKPLTRVHYDLQEIGAPTLKEVLTEYVKINQLVGKIN